MDRRKESQLYMTAIVALGSFGGPDAVEALKFALHQGDFWSPLVTRRIRAAAARRCAGSARRRHSTCFATPRPRGPRGVRSAARSELARTT